MASAALQKARSQLEAVRKSANKRVQSVKEQATSVGAVAGGAAIAGALSGAGLDIEVSEGFDMPIVQAVLGLGLSMWGGSMTVKKLGQGMVAGSVALAARDFTEQAWADMGDDGEDD
jgi:hypothetical protein